MLIYHYQTTKKQAEETLDKLAEKWFSIRNIPATYQVWVEKRAENYVLHYKSGNVSFEHTSKWTILFEEPDKLVLKRQMTWDMIFWGMTLGICGVFVTGVSIASIFMASVRGTVSGKTLLFPLIGLGLRVILWLLYWRNPIAGVKKFFETETYFT